MWNNYIKIAWRNLQRNKVYSFINILGLALGLATTILILLSVENEVSFDRFHRKEAVLYEVWNSDKIDGNIQCWNVTCGPLGPALKQEIPEISETNRFVEDGKRLVAYKDKSLLIKGANTEPSFLTMFSFPLLKGNALTALAEINSIVITESLAKKIFGDEDPMYKMVRFENKENVTVTGVMKDLPNNTKFHFEYLMPWTYLMKDEANLSAMSFWGNNSFSTYVELKPGASADVVNSKIKNIIRTHSNEEESIEPFIYPIRKWHLYANFENGKPVGGRIAYLKLITIIAAFILLIACINFMNLSTARSEKRAREVGIRKVVGAERGGLIVQFLGESVFMAVIAFMFAIVIVQLVLPSYNHLVVKELSVNYANPWYWLSAIAIVLVTGIIAGSYPAFYLSSFLPVNVLKGMIIRSKGSVTPRKVLVVSQFIFSIALIICTIVMERQLQYAKDRPSGYNIDRIVYHSFTGDIPRNYKLIKDELLSSGVAVSVFKTSSPVSSTWSNTWGLSWQGKHPGDKTLFERLVSSDGYVTAMQIPVIAGRDLNVDLFPSDTTSMVLNEAAVKAMGFKDPVGQIITDDSVDYRVVGVVKNFITQSAYAPIGPLIIKGRDWSNFINMRFSATHSVADNLKAMERIFKKYNPAYPFEYKFADESYAQKFQAEQIVGKLASASALLAIIISCLGLFGLAAFTAEQRTKEIAIRKVAGASVMNIVTLLSKDFLKLVLLAALISFPISWWAMSKFLQTYSYRISLSAGIFVLAGTLAILIAFITVSFQAVKAANTNPVKNLRSE